VPELLNDPVVLRHSARASDLEPDTAYAYSVGNGTAAGMSPWAVVKTGPRRPGDVHLLYMGDPQCGLEGWGRLLADARRRQPEAGALLIAGDLVDRGNERSNWDHFFLRAAGVFERLPVMPAVGNHEYLDRGPRLYRAFFNLPANGPEGVDPGLVYAFEYGDAFIAVLDSTPAVSSPRAAARQAAWLDTQLARTGCRWTIVMFHHPLYASHTKRENLPLRAAWLPVIDRHRVDLVLQGHDHAYLRTYPLRANRRAASVSDGTVYVVAVSGDKYYDQDPRDYTEVGLTHTSTYQTIDITGGGRLAYRAWDAAGRVVDAFEIVKPTAASRLAGR
jgi:3',5'-cyclic AMP phosphodiesterase CpdA